MEPVAARRRQRRVAAGTRTPPARLVGHLSLSPRFPTGGCKSTLLTTIKKLAKFTLPLLSSFNKHQNVPLCLLRKLHAFESPWELPSCGSPRRGGQGLAQPAIALPFQILPKLGCPSDISQKLILWLTSEKYDFVCFGFTVCQGFLEVTNTALTTCSSSPLANSTCQSIHFSCISTAPFK